MFLVLEHMQYSTCKLYDIIFLYAQANIVCSRYLMVSLGSATNVSSQFDRHSNSCTGPAQVQESWSPHTDRVTNIISHPQQRSYHQLTTTHRGIISFLQESHWRFKTHLKAGPIPNNDGQFQMKSIVLWGMLLSRCFIFTFLAFSLCIIPSSFLFL